MDEIPKLKRTLRSFLLDEDARVIDKAVSKVAIISSFFALNFIMQADDAHAKGHHNHSNHSNHVFHKGMDPEYANSGNESITKSYSQAGRNFNVEIGGKQVTSAHGNHYNHANGSGKS